LTPLLCFRRIRFAHDYDYIRKKMILGFDDLRSWRFEFLTLCVPGVLRFLGFEFLGVCQIQQ